MVFEPGNKWWEKRASSGRNPIFATPEDLAKAAMEYVEWNEANPLLEEKVFCNQGEVTRTTLSKMRAMTKEGLCIFLDITSQTWTNYCEREEFKDVCAKINLIIYQQKFTGAAADLLNQNVICRELSLIDQKGLGGPTGGPIETVDLTKLDGKSPEELSQMYRDMVRGDSD